MKKNRKLKLCIVVLCSMVFLVVWMLGAKMLYTDIVPAFALHESEILRAIAEDQEGKEYLINARGEKISDSYDEIFEIDLENSLKYVRYCENGNYGYLNSKTGKVHLKASFAYADAFFEDSITIIGNENGKCFMDSTGHIPYETLDDAEGFSEGIYYAKVMNDGKWGILNRWFRTVISCEYEEMGTICKVEDLLYATAKRNGEIVILNLRDESEMRLPYIWISECFSEKYYTVMDAEQRMGIIDVQGKVILPLAKYDWISEPDANGYISVKKNDKFGVISIDKEREMAYTVIPMEYDQELVVNTKGYAIGKKGDEYELVHVTLGCQTMNMEEIHSYQNDMAVFKRNGKFGFLDAKGNVCIPEQYKSVKQFLEEFTVVVDEDNSSYIIDKSGKLVYQPMINEDIYILKGNFFVSQNTDGIYELKKIEKMADNTYSIQCICNNIIQLYEDDFSGYYTLKILNEDGKECWMAMDGSSRYPEICELFDCKNLSSFYEIGTVETIRRKCFG